MKTLHKLAFFVLLPVAILACSISAPVAVTISATAENTLTPPKNKLDNAPKTQAGYISTVTADLLNIRTAPSHASPIIPHVWLIEGEQVTVIECHGVWGRIGTGRWVNTIYLAKGCE